MSLPSAMATEWHPPADVLALATRHQAQDCLGPLREALLRLYPNAHNVRVFLEDDPEIRDDWHVVFEAFVPAADLSDYLTATRPWYRELACICPAPSSSLFRLSLIPDTP
ncbi:MAG: hypothetical protein K2R98_12390 [Gemmataceae bacterium]|nr:hypothetical protein [Gemmataceae bacterium]